MILAETLVDADDVVGIVGDYFVDGAIPMQVSMSDAEVAEAGADARQVSVPDADAEFSPNAAETDAMADAKVAEAGADARQVSMSDAEMPSSFPMPRRQIQWLCSRCRRHGADAVVVEQMPAPRSRCGRRGADADAFGQVPMSDAEA